MHIFVPVQLFELYYYKIRNFGRVTVFLLTKDLCIFSVVIYLYDFYNIGKTYKSLVKLLYVNMHKFIKFSII